MRLRSSHDLIYRPCNLKIGRSDETTFRGSVNLLVQSDVGFVKSILGVVLRKLMSLRHFLQ